MSHTVKTVPLAGDWIAELDKLDKAQQAEGFSTEELARAISRNTQTTQGVIRKGIDAGLLVYAGKRREMSVMGTPKQVPVFKVVKRKK